MKYSLSFVKFSITVFIFFLLFQVTPGPSSPSHWIDLPMSTLGSIAIGEDEDENKESDDDKGRGPKNLSRSQISLSSRRPLNIVASTKSCLIAGPDKREEKCEEIVQCDYNRIFMAPVSTEQAKMTWEDHVRVNLHFKLKNFIFYCFF